MTNTTNSSVLAPLFEEIASLVSGSISEFQERSFRELSSAHEWGIALESLCDFLYEDSIEISRKAYQVIERAGLLVGLDEDNWMDLREQIVER